MARTYSHRQTAVGWERLKEGPDRPHHRSWDGTPWSIDPWQVDTIASKPRGLKTDCNEYEGRMRCFTGVMLREVVKIANSSLPAGCGEVIVFEEGDASAMPALDGEFPDDIDLIAVHLPNAPKNYSKYHYY